MSRDNNHLKQKDGDIYSHASSCLENSDNNQIPNEIFDIAKLLARIAVDEYFKGQ